MTLDQSVDTLTEEIQDIADTMKKETAPEATNAHIPTKYMITSVYTDRKMGCVAT